jgi:hypothetical protein
VDAGSREENASNKNRSPASDPVRTREGSGKKKFHNSCPLREWLTCSQLINLLISPHFRHARFFKAIPVLGFIQPFKSRR